MKSNTINSPSSSSWVKFEESEELLLVPTRVFPTPVSSSSSLVGRREHRDWTRDRGAAQWGHNRYSVFDNLRFGLHSESQTGWSSYLLGEPGDSTIVD